MNSFIENQWQSSMCCNNYSNIGLQLCLHPWALLSSWLYSCDLPQYCLRNRLKSADLRISRRQCVAEITSYLNLQKSLLCQLFIWRYICCIPTQRLTCCLCQGWHRVSTFFSYIPAASLVITQFSKLKKDRLREQTLKLPFRKVKNDDIKTSKTSLVVFKQVYQIYSSLKNSWI